MYSWERFLPRFLEQGRDLLTEHRVVLESDQPFHHPAARVDEDDRRPGLDAVAPPRLQGGIWIIFVWSFFAGAITRIAAVERRV